MHQFWATQVAVTAVAVLMAGLTAPCLHVLCCTFWEAALKVIEFHHCRICFLEKICGNGVKCPVSHMKLQNSYSRTEEWLFWKKLFTSHSQLQLSKAILPWVGPVLQLWLYFVYKLGGGGQGGKANPKQRKNPKQNMAKACGNNSPNNLPGLALVARKESRELQSGFREAAAVAVVGQTDGQQDWGLERGPGAAHGEEVVPTDFCILPVLTTCNPARPLSGVALKCFPPPSCGGTLCPSRGWPEGRPRNGGHIDTE